MNLSRVTLHIPIPLPGGVAERFFLQEKGWVMTFDPVKQLVHMTKDGVKESVPTANVIQMREVEAKK